MVVPRTAQSEALPVEVLERRLDGQGNANRLGILSWLWLACRSRLRLLGPSAAHTTLTGDLFQICRSHSPGVLEMGWPPRWNRGSSVVPRVFDLESRLLICTRHYAARPFRAVTENCGDGFRFNNRSYMQNH